MNKDAFYITTPIYYINDKPHVGHAYTTIIADVLARYERARGNDVIFSVGVDENAQKTVDAAAKFGEDIKTYTDRLAGVWKQAWEPLHISYTDFIRTTEEQHKKTVYEFWDKVNKNGDIYKGVYEGLYCKGHEAFMKESDLVDGICPDHKTKPEHIKENNYFFRLSKYQKPLLEFYKSNPNFVAPSYRFNEVKKFVEQGLEDLSISRETQKWGIPVPGDPDHVIYVWFDALINYITIVGINEWKKHPAIHAVGKDILRFHAIIWPAMLLSAGLPLPKQIIANGFFTNEGLKISKSLGNAIDPIDIVREYGADALRYFLLREIPYGEDGDFSLQKLKERYNGDLANGLGNFVARVCTLAVQAKKSLEKDASKEIDERVQKTEKNVNIYMEEYKFHEALIAIWELISFGDKYLNDTKPWSLEDENKKNRVIADALGIVHALNLLLAPFLPETAEKIAKSVKLDGKKYIVANLENLFPRA